jgi:hypothetical protein
LGSANELEYHLLLAYDLRLLGEGAYRALSRRVEEVQRMPAARRRAYTAAESEDALTADAAQPTSGWLLTAER